VRWIRLWTEQTVYGTTFQELTAAERGIWFSLLVVAGLPPTEGIIELRKRVGYTPEGLAAFLQVDKDELVEAIRKLIDLKKLSTLPRKSSRFPLELRLKVCNWKHYQTEYAQYRKSKRPNAQGLGPLSNSISKPLSKTDKDIDLDLEKDRDKETTKGPRLDPVAFQEAWNSHPSLKRIRSMTKDRRRKLAVRAEAKDFRDNWQQAIDALTKIPFYRGENDRGWRANIDWFLRNDTNWLQALERIDTDEARVEYSRDKIRKREQEILEQAEKEQAEREAELSPRAQALVRGLANAKDASRHTD